MATLAGVYLHIDMELSENEKSEAKHYLEQLTKDFLCRLYHQDINLSIEIRDGSVKIWLSVAGAIYLTIGQYGSFRAGIDQLIKDSHTVKSFITSTLLKGGLSQSLLLEEKRLITTPEKARKILSKIERAQTMLHTMNSEQVQKELSIIYKSVDKLFIELSSHEDQKLFIDAVPSEIQKKLFPYHNEPPYKYINDSYFAHIRRRNYRWESPFQKNRLELE